MFCPYPRYAVTTAKMSIAEMFPDPEKNESCCNGIQTECILTTTLSSILFYLTSRGPFRNFLGAVTLSRWPAKAAACRESIVLFTNRDIYVICCVKSATEVFSSVFAAPFKPQSSLVT